jgi:hypothetical protein
MQVNFSWASQELQFSFISDKVVFQAMYTNYGLEVIREESVVVIKLRGAVTEKYFLKFRSL